MVPVRASPAAPGAGRLCERGVAAPLQALAVFCSARMAGSCSGLPACLPTTAPLMPYGRRLGASVSSAGLCLPNLGAGQVPR